MIKFNFIFDKKTQCPRGEIGRHKGLKILSVIRPHFNYFLIYKSI